MEETWENRSKSSPLMMGRGNEGIKFVEDDDSSSEIIGNKTPELVITPDTSGPFLQVPRRSTAASASFPSEKSDDNYAEISSVSSSFVEATASNPNIAQKKSKLRKNSDIVLNILSRSTSLRRTSRKEYDKVPTKEDNPYSSIAEGETTSRGKLSGSSSPDGRRDTKSDEEELILESLRQVVRKCTNPDPVKRPSTNDVLDIINVDTKS